MWDTYKSFLIRFVHPSFFSMLFTVGGILISYGTIFNEVLEIAVGGFCVVVGSGGSVLVIALRKSKAENNNLFFKNIVLFAFIPFFCGVFAALQVMVLVGNQRSANDSTFDNKHIFIGNVVEACIMRYHVEAVLELGKTAEVYKTKVVAYLPLDVEVSSGDEVHFVRQPQFFKASHTKDRFIAGLLRKGISGRVKLSHSEFGIEPTNSSKARNALRARISHRIESIFSQKTAALLKGLYFGNKNHIEKETVQNFTWAGVLHILAASGAHLATVVFLPFLLLSFFNVNRYLTVIITTGLVVGYLWITDMPVSLVRATIMFAFGGAHLIIQHQRKPLNILFHAAGAILIFEPWQLYQLGFQLTFSATAGILLFYKNCQKAFSFLPKVISAPIAITISAQSLVYPVLAFHLGEVNIISLVSNLFIVPLVQCIFAGSFVVLIVDAITSFQLSYGAILIDKLYDMVRNMTAVLASLPGHFVPEKISPILLIPYVLFLIPCLPLKKFQALRAISAPLACICTWYMLFTPLPPNNQIAIVTEKSAVAIFINNSQAIIEGTISTMEDARTIVRIVKNHRLNAVKMKVKNLNYQSAAAIVFIVKNLNVISFEIAGSYQMGSYLGHLFAVLDRDGVNVSFY